MKRMTPDLEASTSKVAHVDDAPKETEVAKAFARHVESVITTELREESIMRRYLPPTRVSSSVPVTQPRHPPHRTSAQIAQLERELEDFEKVQLVVARSTPRDVAMLRCIKDTIVFPDSKLHAILDEMIEAAQS